MLSDSVGNFGTDIHKFYDWHQNASELIITIRIASLKESDVKVTIVNDTLDVLCSLLDGSQFRMHLCLYRDVNVNESSWLVDTSKLTICLKKVQNKRWQSLEYIPDKTSPVNPSKMKKFLGLANVMEIRSELNMILNSPDFEIHSENENPITIVSYVDDPQQFSLDYNWFQSDEYVNVIINLPDIDLSNGFKFLFYEDDITLYLTPTMLNWLCRFPHGVTSVHFRLFKRIDSQHSRYEISACRTKMEMHLKKEENGFWEHFLCQAEEEEKPEELEPGVVEEVVNGSEEKPIEESSKDDEVKTEVGTTAEEPSYREENGQEDTEGIISPKRARRSARRAANE